MGCGVSMCEGATNQPQQISQVSVRILRSLISTLKSNPYLIPDVLFRQYLFKMQLNINNFILKAKNKLIERDEPRDQIKIKWKIILFCTDNTVQNYRKCLGFDIIKQKTEQKQQQVNKQVQAKQQLQDNQNKKKSHKMKQQKELQMQLLNHPCFQQIDKDLDRTFQLPGLKKQQFSYVLKRIANHFPRMGYTQGINFIVGYLLIIGFSSSDSFWIFTHLTLNRKYMLLGLFQDQFPLSKVYTIIFKNILRRTKQGLYQHLYNVLFIDDSIWIFKWFMTCFLYSFPIQICQYVLDVVISIGGIGLVYLAVAIVSLLQNHLIKFTDVCDISMFLAQLKDINCFNEFVKIHQVLQLVYRFQLIEQDLEGLQINTEGEHNMYGRYVNAYYKKYIKILKPKNNAIEQQVKEDNLKQTEQTYFPVSKLYIDSQNEECNKLLDRWYQSLITERKHFISSQGYTIIKGNKIKIHLPHFSLKKPNLKQKVSSLKINNLNPTHQNQHLEEFNPRIKHHAKLNLKGTENNTDFILRHTISFEESQNNEGKQQAMSTQSRFRNLKKHTKKYKLSQEIDELWDEQEQKNSSQQSHNTFKINNHQEQTDKQVDKCQIQNKEFQIQMNQRRKRKGSKNSLGNDVKVMLKSQNNIKVKTQEEQAQDKPFNKVKPIPFINSNNNDDDILTMNLDLQHKISQKTNNKIGKITSSLNNNAVTKNNNNSLAQNNNMLLMVGKTIMTSFSISNASMSNKSSTSSKQGAKVKKCKQNGIIINSGYRDCSCKKIKDQQERKSRQINQYEDEQCRNKEIQEKKCEAHDKNNRYRNSDGQKIAKEIQQMKGQIPDQKSQRKRLVTFQEWMINSHVTHPNIDKYQSEMGSEVEILDGQLFKKKNKVSNRINGGTLANNVISAHSQQKSNVNNLQLPLKTNLNRLQHQQSCQSIVINHNNSEGKTSRMSAIQHNINQFQIQSVK